VEREGLTLPGVTLAIKYDGSPVLQRDGCFMAGLAMGAAAEPESLVIRATREDREGLIADAPHIYYVTDYHRRYPVVLVRLARIDNDVLRELLTMSWRLTAAKAPTRAAAARRARQ
jgi:hypothetical protein